MRWKYFMQLFSISILFHLTYSKPANQWLKVVTNPTSASAKLTFSYERDGKEIFQIEFGKELKYHPERNCGIDCYAFDNAQLLLTVKDDEDWFTAEWNRTDPQLTITDCFDLKDYSWFGGPEQKKQYWPTDQLVLKDFPMITQENGNAAVIEPYWLSQSGAYIYVDENTPLFVNQDRTESNQACFTAKIAEPYSLRQKLHFKYHIVFNNDAKEAHKHAIKNFLGKPTDVPAGDMITEPIWSTWAKYKREIDADVVLNFANEIKGKGYSGQFEIDDNWEECYGSLTFNKEKFPKPKTLVRNIRRAGFKRVTLWVHPFINKDCTDYFNEAQEKGYLVKDKNGNVLTKWWNSKKEGAALIDFTNDEAKKWWSDRLKALKKATGLDSFKFDAGESSWAPQIPQFTGDEEQQPNLFTKKYVEACSEFGDLIEVRSGYRSQNLPNFVRIVDKDSKWTLDNGLPTLITTMLQMNMVGYPFVLPDMVGGNQYGADKVDKELFIRWLQANTFMPSIQFSLTPWDFDEETEQISQKMVELHQKYAPKIIELMKKSVKDGTPLNPPIWWIAPDDPNTYTIDDQYMLGEEILVAPIVKKDAIKRDVYLPKGKWKNLVSDEEVNIDKGQFKSFDAPLDTLLYFELAKE